MGLIHLLKNPPKSSFTQEIFSFIQLDQAPRQFNNYQHQQTLQSFLNVITTKLVNIEAAVDLMNNFPIVEFIINLYVRNCIMKFINEGPINSPLGMTKQLQNQVENIELMGNQQDVLCEYNAQIRGNLLNLLALYLGVHAKVIYKRNTQDKQNNTQPEVSQQFGHNSFPLKVQILYKTQDKLRISFVSIENLQSKVSRPKTPLIRQQITQSSYRYPNRVAQSGWDQTKSLRNQLSSKSVTKDNLTCSSCSLCGNKQKFCQCSADQKRKKGVTPRGLNTSLTANLKSMFDVLAKQQNMINQTVQTQKIVNNIDPRCNCNRPLCRICRKK